MHDASHPMHCSSLDQHRLPLVSYHRHRFARLAQSGRYSHDHRRKRRMEEYHSWWYGDGNAVCWWSLGSYNSMGAIVNWHKQRRVLDWESRWEWWTCMKSGGRYICAVRMHRPFGGKMRWARSPSSCIVSSPPLGHANASSERSSSLYHRRKGKQRMEEYHSWLDNAITCLWLRYDVARSRKCMDRCMMADGLTMSRHPADAMSGSCSFSPTEPCGLKSGSQF